MTLAEMDAHYGVNNRMKKIKYNLEKFYLLEKELQPYHKELMNMTKSELDKIGQREVCRQLGEKYNVSNNTIRMDLSLLIRYDKIK